MHVTPFLERQIPLHVRKDYPLFVTFMKYYFEYLEQENYPIDVISRFQTLRDVTENPTYAGDIASEIFHALPGTTAADKTNLLFKSQEFFRAKGTADALTFIYRVVFGTEITLSYPGDDILIASEGRWKAWDAIEVLGDARGETSLTQAGTGATADIVDVSYVTDRVSTMNLSEWNTASLSSASEISGTWTFWTNTGTTMVIVLEQSGSPIPLLDTTLYSAIRPVFELYGGSVPTIAVYDEATSAYVNLTLGTDGYYDMSALTGPISSIRFTTTENVLALKSVTLLHAPLSVIEVENVSGTFDLTAIGSYTPLTIVTVEDGYLDRKHLISETSKIFDGNLISEFSYMIDGVNRKDVRENAPALRRLTHPAGFSGFYHFEDNYLANVPAHFSMDETGTYSYGPFVLTDPEEALTLAWTDNTAETVTITVTFYDDASPIGETSTAFTSGGTVTPPDGAVTMGVEISVPADAGQILTFTGLSLYHTIYADTLSDDWHETV